MPLTPSIPLLAPLLFVLPLALGCAASAAAPPATAQPGPLPILHRGDDPGAGPLELSELADRASRSDIVLIGELHGHPVGLPWAARFFEQLARRAIASSPPKRTALALEFLERDVQSDVDQLCAGSLSEQAFLERTKLRPDPWKIGHGRMVATARELGVPVVAANAPRTYTKRARTEGYDALRALPEEERALFALPDPLPGGRYRDGFAAMMGGHEGLSEEQLEGFFRAQAVWDATMADSVARTLDRGHAPVVLVVGRFHVEHDGGVVQLLRRAKPDTKLLVVSMIESREELEPGRADVMVEVGPAPEG